jgi:AcrR family transcriptional regulator
VVIVDRSETTRQKLIDTAELLFADRGFDAVSLREIGVAAGQRFTSSAQYHFGSKEGLIAAIVEARIPAIDARRHEMLDEIESGGYSDNLRRVVEVLVVPPAERAASDGGRYVRFMARLYLQGQDSALEQVDPSFNTGTVRAIELIERVLPDLPIEICRQRIVLGVIMVVHALASRDALTKHGSAIAADPAELLVNNLIDSYVGILTAPVVSAAPLLGARSTGTRTRSPSLREVVTGRTDKSRSRARSGQRARS